MTTGTLYIFSGPSGCGKTSLVKALLTIRPQVEVSISYTTRPSRSGEVNGAHYQFVTLEHFQKMVRQNDFLEYAKVFDHYYGTSRNWVDQKLQQGIDIILEIDWQGMQQVKKHYPNTINIFILPPSLLHLKKRLLKRDKDTIEIIENRLKQAKIEIKHFREYDYLVVNNEFQQAVADADAIFSAHHLRTAFQSNMAQSLLTQ